MSPSQSPYQKVCRTCDILFGTWWGLLAGVMVVAVAVGAGLILLRPEAVHHSDDLVHFQMAAWSFVIVRFGTGRDFSDAEFLARLFGETP